MRFAKRRAAIRRESVEREIRRREKKRPRHCNPSYESLKPSASRRCCATSRRTPRARRRWPPSRWRRCATGSGSRSISHLPDSSSAHADPALVSPRSRTCDDGSARSGCGASRRRDCRLEKDALERKKAAINIGRMLRGWVAQQIVTRLLWEKYELERRHLLCMQCMIRCWFARTSWLCGIMKGWPAGRSRPFAECVRKEDYKTGPGV